MMIKFWKLTGFVFCVILMAFAVKAAFAISMAPERPVPFHKGTIPGCEGEGPVPYAEYIAARPMGYTAIFYEIWPGEPGRTSHTQYPGFVPMDRWLNDEKIRQVVRASFEEFYQLSVCGKGTVIDPSKTPQI